MSEEKVVSIEQKLTGDIFDNLNQLRLDQNFSEAIGVKRQITTISVKKPNRQEFIRVHSDESYHLPTAIIELKEERENYLVTSDLRFELPDEVVHKMLYTTINRQGVLFLWPVRMPDETNFNRLDKWNSSAHKAAKLAMDQWVRVASSREAGHYETFIPTGELPEPEWPGLDFSEILRIAFEDLLIDSADHPVLKRLRGEI